MSALTSLGWFQGLWMISVDGCADSTSDGKAYAAKFAASPAGMLELPRARFSPNFGIVGGLLPKAACFQSKSAKNLPQYIK